MEIKIYLLKDPRTNEVRYVGCSKNIQQRFKNHLNKARDLFTDKRKWLEELRTLKLKPLLEIIESVEDSNYLEREKYWIKYYREKGCNLTNTGDINFNGNQTSFQKNENNISIVAIQLDGTFFNSYSSIILASQNTKINKSNIQSVLSKKTKTAGNLIWVYEKDYFNLTENDINKLIENALDNSKKGNESTQFKKGHVSWNKGTNIKLKPDKNVFQYCPFTGIFLKEWNTAKEAGQTLNINITGIGQCCNNRSKSAGGYVWRYYKQDKIKIINNIKLKIKTS